MITEAITATPIPIPDTNGAVASTVNTMVTATTSFFTNAWPALVGLILLIVFALLVLRFGMTGIRRLIRFGRG